MRPLHLFILCLTPLVLLAADIPDRPEKLTFPSLTFTPPNPADYRVQLKAGPVAYVVPDRELPLVSISITVRTGGYVVPEGKEGLEELTGYLIARGGTASKKAEELEERLAFLAAQLGSSVGETRGSVSLNLLSKDLDEGLSILREVLTQPRFQDDKLALRKQQMVQSMKQRNDESEAIEDREASFLAYGEKFWANRQTTAASVEAVTRVDIEAFHKRWFHPANFTIAVSGDFEREAMVVRLEKLLGDWPWQGDKPPAVPTDTRMASPGVYMVNKDVNQGRVTVMLPGILREDPDFMPARLMNYILGGGGFTSRLMTRIRSDEGLAYSAGSSVPGGIDYPLAVTASFQSKSPTVAYATSIILEELGTVRNQPVSDDELNSTKKYFTEVFPRTFASKSAVAATFADDEFTGRFAKHPDFWKTYRDRLNAVTKADVQRAAQRILNTNNLVVLVVGQKDEILKGHPTHKTSLKEIGRGSVSELPLRDPLTMKPITSGELQPVEK